MLPTLKFPSPYWSCHWRPQSGTLIHAVLIMTGTGHQPETDLQSLQHMNTITQQTSLLPAHAAALNEMCFCFVRQQDVRLFSATTKGKLVSTILLIWPQADHKPANNQNKNPIRINMCRVNESMGRFSSDAAHSERHFMTNNRDGLYRSLFWMAFMWTLIMIVTWRIWTRSI